MSTRPEIDKPDIPNRGLYDLVFTERGFLRGGRYDKPHKCSLKTLNLATNECKVCGETYYDFEPDEGDGIGE